MLVKNLTCQDFFRLNIAILRYVNWSQSV